MTNDRRLVSALIVGSVSGAVSEYLMVKKQTGAPPPVQTTMDGLIRGAVAAVIATFYLR